MIFFTQNYCILILLLIVVTLTFFNAPPTQEPENKSQKMDYKRQGNLPIINVSGTHYEVGYAIGQTFGKLIADFLKAYKPLKEMLKMYNTTDGKNVYDECLKLTKEYFPQYVIELEAMASGAGILFHHLFLIHMDEILPSALQLPSANNQGTGCTTIMYNWPGKGQYFAHNEDALKVAINSYYIVKAHIVPAPKEEKGVFAAREEKWAAMTSAGLLPGYASGYNQHGLVFTVNTIFAKNILRERIPRTFITRALLASRDTLNEVQDILENSGVGSADAFHVNVGFLNEKVTSRMFYSIEVTPSEKDTMSNVVTKLVAPGSTSFYANKLQYSVPICQELEGDGWKSSNDRERLYQKLTSQRPIQSLRDILRVLGATQTGKAGRIFRDSDDDNVITINTSIFDFGKKKWILWTKNPTTTRPLIKLSLDLSFITKEDKDNTADEIPNL